MKINKEDLRKKEVWSGTYRGISFEIVKWSYNDSLTEGYDNIKYIWNFYLILSIDAFPKQLHKELWLKPKNTKYDFISYGYYESKILANIEFHGGITYYKKLLGYDGGKKVIKAGCDYNHAWDQGNRYNIDDLIWDVKVAIDSLFELVDGLLIHCYLSGKYYSESDGYVLRDGSFISWEEIIKINERMSKKNF